MKRRIKKVIKNLMFRKKPPMFRHRYMAHALGGYEGYKYLNSEEALINSLKNGFKFVEVDISITDDDNIVCSHGWTEKDCNRCGMDYQEEFSENMTLELFSQQTMHGMKAIPIETLYGYMKKYPRLYLEFDVHIRDTDDGTHVIEKLVEAFHYDEKVLNRCLMQVYNKKMYKEFNKAYHFKHYQYLIGTKYKKLDDHLNFCRKNQINAIALNKNYITDEQISKAKKLGFSILVYSIDDREEAEALFRKGVNTVCTNFIEP